MKALLSFLLLIFLLSENSFAVFDGGLVSKAKGLTSKHYVIDGEEISTAVQTLNFLGYQLQKTDNADTAKNFADTIIGIVSTGEGVGGLRTPASRRPLMNRPEKELTIGALTRAVEYLQLKGLFDEANLTARILEMFGRIRPEEPVKKHAAIVSSLMYGAHAKAVGIADFISAKMDWISRLPDGIRALLVDDTHWRHVTTYMLQDLQRYNEIEWQSVQEKYTRESESDKAIYGTFGPFVNYSAGITVPADLMSPETEALIDSLEKTYVPAKAIALMKVLQRCLMDAPLKSMGTPPERSRIIRAIVAIEKFRLLEVTAGGFDKMDPTALEYKDDSKDPENQAILMTLVSTVDNYLYHPSATLEDLKHRCFNYQTNDSLWPEVVRTRAKTLAVDEIINPELITAIDATKVAINQRQRIVLDQLLAKQQLIFQGVPEFDFVSGTFRVSHRFLHFIKSLGNGQCGYYSARYLNGKSEYTKKITDNLKDPGIRSLAEKLLYVGRTPSSVLAKRDIIPQIPDIDRIVRAINEAKEDTVREQGYRELAKLIGKPIAPDARMTIEIWEKEAKKEAADKAIEGNKASIEAEVKKAAEEKRVAMEAEINRILKDNQLVLNILDPEELARATKILEENKAAIEAEAKKIGEGKRKTEIRRILEENKAAIEAEAKEIFKNKQRNHLNKRLKLMGEDLHFILKGKDLSVYLPRVYEVMGKLDRLVLEQDQEPLFEELAQLIDPSISDLKEMVEKEIDKIDDGGYLEMGSNAEWMDQKFTFPLVTSLLNNDDIYVWIDTAKKTFHRSIYENRGTSLVNFVSARTLAPGSKPRRIHMYNTNGQGHYDKWVEADDYLDLAHALRHKKLMGLSDTAPPSFSPSSAMDDASSPSLKDDRAIRGYRSE